jgi:hypothetical protein
VVYNDPVGYLNDLRTQTDPEHRWNIEAARNAVLAGTEIGDDEIVSDNRRIMKLAVWKPSMGKYFTPQIVRAQSTSHHQKYWTDPGSIP